MLKLLSKKGFTLIELMIVVAIIGILAAIAIPQFASMVAKSQEGATKGNLGTIRSALSIYYGDTEGYYPTDAMTSLTLNSKYLKVIPNANMPRTSNNAVQHAATNTVNTESLADGYAGNETGWGYDNTFSGTAWGQVVVACTHSDVKGTKWTSF